MRKSIVSGEPVHCPSAGRTYGSARPVSQELLDIGMPGIDG
jgi:hypothetical protein